MGEEEVFLWLGGRGVRLVGMGEEEVFVWLVTGKMRCSMVGHGKEEVFLCWLCGRGGGSLLGGRACGPLVVMGKRRWFFVV